MIDKETIDWMQGKWRDCADRAAQMRIFRDMTRAPVEEICEALGEDPAQFVKSKSTARGKIYRVWTPEEDAQLLQMRREDVDCSRIAEIMGRGLQSIYSRLKKLRNTGAMPVSEPEKEKPAEEKKATKAKKTKSAVAWDQSAEQEILALIEYEQKLVAELETVRGEIERKRDRLAELISLAGGMMRESAKKGEKNEGESNRKARL